MLSPLERLGLEVVAFDLLGRRISAATLVQLISANGKQVGWSALANVRMWRLTNTDEPATKGAVKVRMCLLRAALEDIGLGGVIKTCGGDTANGPANGYALPEPGRTAVINRLLEEVA